MRRLILELPFRFPTPPDLLISSPPSTKSSSLHEAQIRSLHLSRVDIFSLLSAAFCCIMPSQDRHIEARRVDFPWCNLLMMMSAASNSPDAIELKASKLRAILEYFLRVGQRIDDDMSSVEREIVTYSRVSVAVDIENADTMSSAAVRQLIASRSLPPVRLETNVLIEDLDAHLQIDFANEYAGGGVMNSGCVQEEIRFLLSPELLLSCLVFARLEHHESFVIHGTERFSNYIGYGFKYRFAGATQDATPLEDIMIDERQRRRRASVVVGIDALCFGGRSFTEQFSARCITRDLVKAFAGFALPTESTAAWPVASGNWGCGVFGGDPELKFLIQWLAATAASRSLVYVMFDNSGDLKEKIESILRLLAQAPEAARDQLAGWLLEGLWTLEAQLGPAASSRRPPRGQRQPQGPDQGSVLERVQAFIARKLAAQM
ncbi:hypothetical protein PINS_up022543 [Pythium insidiosum]|nr:hypothetical protein PINS_up022543 [Pythium insidiosum]